MNNPLKSFLIAVGMFLLIVVAGGLLIDKHFLPLGRTVESCVLYLAGVVGAEMFWIGSNR